MEKNKIFDATEFKNVKEIIYDCVYKFNEKPVFVIKHKENEEVNYENISYRRFLEDINKLGTAFFDMGLKGKRVAVIGKNRYEWILTHLANLLRWNCFRST